MRKKKEDLKFCTNCGKELKSDSFFCQYCGTKIEKEDLTDEISKDEFTKTNKDMVQDDIKIIKGDVDSSIIGEKKSRKKSSDSINDEVNVVYNKKDDEVDIKSNISIPVKKDVDIKKGKSNKFENSKKYIYPVIAVVVTFVLCLGAFTCFYQYYLKNLVIETTKREVTISDNGISEAVEKVYDAVVVVESYVNDKLYATGTGFVYKTDDKAGYILTNSHVIDGADAVKVVFTNNKRETVKVVGSDSYSDVALLGIDKDKVTKVAEIGDSEALKLGDTTFAVGSPLDSSTYAWTVTRGVISGKNRTVAVTEKNGYSSSTQVMQVLQTDTAINSGNSGGPLCNSNGEVVGITNMKLSSTSVEGMGFAIPIETAVRYADKFIKGEKITYPYIGVTIYDATPTFRDPEASGVYVENVAKGSPASKGGLQKGDKILKVNGKEVENSSFFKFELYKYEIGEEIEITIERDGKEKTLTITLGSTGTSA